MIARTYTKYLTDPTFVTESIMVKALRYLTPAVYAALALYVIIFGIKVIIGSVRNKAEIFLAVVKFDLILYLVNPNVWFNPKTGDGYAMSLLEIPKELLSYVASVDREFDGTGSCIAGHGINKEHIFNEEVVPGSGYRTHGFDGVKLTVWDWIDCKLLNLVNIGLCNYDSFSLTMLIRLILKTLFSLILMSFLPGGAAIFAILTIMIVFWGMVAMIIYAVMIALLTLKAVFVILMSMLTLSVLIVIAPLMLVFSLFDATKQMFENWFSKVFGYTIYPVFLFLS